MLQMRQTGLHSENLRYMQFGKRRRKALDDRLLPSHKITMPVDNNCKTKIIVDYILSQIENDNRPYLQVEILGTEMLGLLDSGSCNSILGNKGWQIFNTLGLPLEAKNMKCTVANGQTCSILGSLSLPVKVLNKIRVVEFLVKQWGLFQTLGREIGYSQKTLSIQQTQFTFKVEIF